MFCLRVTVPGPRGSCNTIPWVRMNTTWRQQYCLYGIRCVRTSLVAAISFISVISVYHLLALHPRRPVAPLLQGRLLHHGQDAATHNNYFVGKKTFTTSSHKHTTIKLMARTKYKKKESLIVKTWLNKSTASLLYGEQKGHLEKVILWHMIPRYRKPKPDRVTDCGKYRCIVSSNRSRLAVADAVIADAFLLSRMRIKETPVRTSPNQAWIFFTKEPWANYEELFPKENWDTIFNWTLTYQTDSEFVTSYGKVIPDSNLTVKKYDWNKIMKMKKKSVFWLVSNCAAGSQREKYVEELQKYIDVDIVGKCGRKTCLENGTKQNAEPCYQQSRFYLAFESRHCQDYVTEKFFGTFKHHIIPVVRGKANYSSLCPSDLYINTADFQSPQKLAKYLKYLERNNTAYIGYLKRRAQYRVVSTGFRECEICTYLHQLDTHRKSYPSISDWIGRCETPQQPHLH